MTPNIAPNIAAYSGVVEVLTGGSYGLLDREAEVAAVAAAVALAPARNGGVLVVRGPAGIGKSALLRVSERLAEEQSVIVLRARAAPFEREFPYGVVRQLFEPVLARGDLPVEELLAGAASGARAVLGDEPRSSAAPDSQFVVLHGLYWLTANLASHAPLLICVDDVIWCDEASLRYLEFLVRRLEGMAAVVALAYRTGEPGASDVVDALVSDPLARVVQPRPLSEAALAGMLGSELGEEVDPGFCAACREATGGNPLLVTELLRALETEHVRPRASEIARVRRIGAVAVGPAVRRRLAFLGEDVRGVARALAILGESARRDDLAGTSGIGVVELEDVIAALVGVGIVRSGERLSFVHPLVADAVRAALTAAESAQLHQQAVKALVGRGASAWELAPHLVASPVGAHPGAVGLLQEAARWALAAGAPEAAVTYLSRAIAELDPGHDPAPLWLAIGSAKVQAGDPGARADLGRAIELARDVRTRARARIALSVVLFAAGEDIRSIEILDAGLDEVAEVDPELAERMEGHLLSKHRGRGAEPGRLPRRVGERVNRARSARKSRDTVAGRLVLCALAYEEVIGGGAAGEVLRLADRGARQRRAAALRGAGLRADVSRNRRARHLRRARTRRVSAHARDGRGAQAGLADRVRVGISVALRREHSPRPARGRVRRTRTPRSGSGDQYLFGYGLTLARIWLALSAHRAGKTRRGPRQYSARSPNPIRRALVTYALVESRARFHLACGEYQAAAARLPPLSQTR